MRRVAFVFAAVFALMLFAQIAFADGSGSATPVRELTLEERIANLGLYLPDHVKERFDAMQHNPEPTVLLNPDIRFDWRDLGGVSAVKDQGSCGSCWCFAGVGAVESAVLVEDGVEWDLSEQQVMDCNRYGRGCNGGWADVVYEQFQWYGAQEEACYPYRESSPWPCEEDTCIFLFQIQDFIDIYNGVDEIKNALLDAPVSTTFYVPDNFTWDCQPHVTGSINHAVVIVGWDDTLCTDGAWIVKNSWGMWGYQGYFHMPYGSCGMGYGTQRPIYESHLPDLAYTPESFVFDLAVGGEDDQVLTISNNGDGDLHCRLRMFQAAFQDSFGYYWFDSDNPSGPEYDWIDITGIGQVVDFPGNPDNSNTGPTDLGFDFEYYGNSFNSICICSNGWASFTDGSSVSSYNMPIPHTIAPNNLLAPFWTDLDPSAGGEVYFYTNNADSCVISWEDVYDSWEEGIFTFQIVLAAPNSVKYQYKSMGPEGRIERASIGMENGTGTVGLQVSRNEVYTYGETAVEFSLGNPPGEFDWLECDNDHATIYEGGSWDVTLTCSAGDHPEGVYWGVIDLYNNDPDSVHAEIPVLMNVGPTGVEGVDVVALSYALNQNYPNPFNPTTEIRYTLAERTEVRLEVYNLAGQRIATLVDQPQEAGVHAVTWDGSGYASGIYFYKLAAGDKLSTKRMTLLR